MLLRVGPSLYLVQSRLILVRHVGSCSDRPDLVQHQVGSCSDASDLVDIVPDELWVVEFLVSVDSRVAKQTVVVVELIIKRLNFYQMLSPLLGILNPVSLLNGELGDVVVDCVLS